MRYFEIGFNNDTRDECINEDGYAEVDYSICILAERKPSIEEATKFCESDMKKLGYKYVVDVSEIEEEYAASCYDMEDAETRFPIFR